MTQQANWRFCEHCNVMFYDGNPEKGRCLGSLLSGHVAQGFNFNLPYGDPESSTVQANWLCCSKCLAMFYDGSADKGHCAAGETHVASGSNFSLPHDVVETPTAQAAWRYCSLCSAMFFDGYANKGPCPGAATFRTNLGDHHGPHQSSGFDFVLPHGVGSQPGPPAGSIPVSLTGLTPRLSGWKDLLEVLVASSSCFHSPEAQSPQRWAQPSQEHWRLGRD
jgi:hypothetical protein